MDIYVGIIGCKHQKMGVTLTFFFLIKKMQE